ncbi:MAG TPA: crosslink repair DNA glycosylase YcaQ family protein [Ktedonosporobacter sp.]|nr:crosslink repair DNA glycosylase YcaQ family protein [Ktedonosporobacter sp.]
MTIHISREQARRFLATYHFRTTDLPGVFERLGTVQYDPLNPVGRNPDLVFQARIPGYQVDDWQPFAYDQRLIYDAWDKQACLVPISDWSLRARVRELYRPYHDREILQAAPDTAEKILAALDAQGPLSSLEFEDQSRMPDKNSWYGLTQSKRVLRAMWACGMVLTHHRKNGRHYYDRPERVIPSYYYNTTPLLDEDAYHRWIIARRFQAAGLLRPTAEAAIWSACGDGATRKRAIVQLVEEGLLTPVHIGEKAWLYYMPTSALPLLDASRLDPRILFLGPLDSLLWDRKGVLQIFDFDYTWEVYKPLAQRRWGYYVLPVFYGDRFVARLDSRLDNGIWTIIRWWWEPDIIPDADLLIALRQAVSAFLRYLRANEVSVGAEVDPLARDALLNGSVIEKL